MPGASGNRWPLIPKRMPTGRRAQGLQLTLLRARVPLAQPRQRGPHGGGTMLPAAEPLIAALRDSQVQSSVTALGGCEITRTVMVEMLA
jgi:hypothetical protein